MSERSRGITHDEWMAEEQAAEYEEPPHKPPFMFGRPEGWQPEVTYGYSDFGTKETT